jgi:acetyl-CoA carboxylase biotin carboxyl carrier protein
VEIQDLKEILRILEAQDITEFELEQDGVKLRVCRASSAAPPPAAAPVQPGFTLAPLVAGPPVAPPATGSPGEAAAPAPEAPAPEGTLVRSPIVGTFYRSPDPNSPAFASVGDRVKVGQVLCIIEAMKLMNEIEAEVAGEVVKVHPENGQPVQYGDPLFTIRPA